METRRREFLRQISGVTALGSLLGRDTRAGSSQDVSSAETQTIKLAIWNPCARNFRYSQNGSMEILWSTSTVQPRPNVLGR